MEGRMNRYMIRATLFLGVYLVIAGQLLWATDGIYVGTTGNWGDDSKWQNNTVADGTNATAIFKGQSGTHTWVTLETNRTIGNLTLSHVSGSYSFSITNAPNVALTLETTAPTVPTITGSSGSSFDFYTPLLGTQGFVKTGTQPVVLRNPDSTYSGDTVIEQGPLRIAYDSTGLPVTKGPLGISRIVLKPNATLQSASTSERIIGNKIVFDGEEFNFDGGQNFYGTLNLAAPLTLTGNLFLNSKNVGIKLNGVCSDGGSNYTLRANMGSQILYMLNQHTYGGNTLFEGGELKIGVNSVDNPVTAGPLGTGALYLKGGKFDRTGNNGNIVRIANHIYLDGDVQLGTATGYGTLHLDGPVYLTGNHHITSSSYGGYLIYLNAGLSDAGAGYKMRLRSINSTSRLALGGIIKLGGGLELWQGFMAVQAGSSWNVPALALLDSSDVIEIQNVASITTPLPTLTFDRAAPTLWVRGVAGGGVMSAASLQRLNRAGIKVAGYSSETTSLGVNDKLLITNNPPAVLNGMVAPYLLDVTGEFLTYDANDGFKRATYTKSNDINATGTTEKHTVTSAQTLNADNEIYALRTSANISGSGQKLAIGSGGLISAGGTPVIDCDLDFGSAEGLIYNRVSVNTTLNGAISGSNGLTKWGAGVLTLANANNNYSGPTTINEATLKLGTAGALPPNPTVVVNSTGILDLNGNDAFIGKLIMFGGEVRNAIANAPTLTLGAEIISQESYRSAVITPTQAANPLNVALSGPITFDVADGYPAIDMRFGWGEVNTRFVNLSGSGTPITKRGAGTLLLTGASTFTGNTTVENGKLIPYIYSSYTSPLGVQTNNVILRRNGMMEANGTGSIYMQDLSFAGGNILDYNNGTATYKLNLASLSRVGRGTLIIRGIGGSSYWGYSGGGNGHLLIDAWKVAEPPNENGMLPPYLLAAGFGSSADPAIGSFAFVEKNNGRVSNLRAYDGNWSLGEFHKNTIASAGATHTVDMTTAAVLAANAEVWALRTTANLTLNGNATLTLGSGGLVCNANLTVEPKVRFGTGGNDAEAIVYVAGAYGTSATRTATLSGSLTTDKGLTKVGGGILSMLADNSSTLAGDHWVNEGTLRLANVNALKSDAVVNIERGAAVDIAGNYTLAHNFKGLGTITTGNNTLTLTGILTPGFGVGTLGAENLNFQGTLNWEYDENASDLIACKTLILSGQKTINAAWIGQGEAAVGSYPLFTYTGSDPTLGDWSVNAPTDLQGAVSLDSTNKRVILELSEAPKGTVILIR